jgi:phage repressor protein C with HTH and peptisase S24 domain
MLYMSTVGDRIRKAREAAGMTQVDLARAVGVSKVAISAIESGKTKHPSAPVLFKIADALDADAEVISTGFRTPHPTEYMSDAELAEWVARNAPEEPIPSDHVEVPVWDARAGAGGGSINDAPGGPKGSILFRERSLSKKSIRASFCHVCYVHGDSMVPRLRDGDAVLFDVSDKAVKPGKVYVIRRGDETFVKRLFPEGGRIRVSSDNKADPQWADWFVEAGDPEFEVIGRVRWVGSWEE